MLKDRPHQLRPDQDAGLQPLFYTLDGMRGVGALLVCYGHAIRFWGGMPTEYPANPFCVDLFFMLSGYVIAFAYEPRFAAGMSATTFIRQRIVRLYPIYFLALLMGLGVALVATLGDDQELGLVLSKFPPQLFMLPAPSYGEAGAGLFPLNPPAWTLLFELWVNLVYVLVWRWLSLPRLFCLVVISAGVLAVITLDQGHIDMGPDWGTFAGGFARATFGFFLGVLVFRLNGSRKSPPKRMSAWAVVATAAVVVLCIIPQTEVTRPFVALAVVCIAGPILLHWGQAIQPPRQLLALFARFGAISYAMYMIHYPIIEAMIRLNWRADRVFMTYAPYSGLAILIATVSLAYLVDRYYDGPARAWLNARLKWISRRTRGMGVFAQRRPTSY